MRINDWSSGVCSSDLQNLALHLMQSGVNVSCLCPGPVMTTAPDAMKHFSENYTMRAPGSHLWVKSQQETAKILSDAIEQDRIIIPTHEEVWKTLPEVAAGPDAFIANKHAELPAGDNGKPAITQAVIDPINAHAARTDAVTGTRAAGR